MQRNSDQAAVLKVGQTSTRSLINFTVAQAHVNTPHRMRMKYSRDNLSQQICIKQLDENKRVRLEAKEPANVANPGYVKPQPKIICSAILKAIIVPGQNLAKDRNKGNDLMQVMKSGWYVELCACGWCVCMCNCVCVCVCCVCWCNICVTTK